MSESISKEPTLILTYIARSDSPRTLSQPMIHPTMARCRGGQRCADAVYLYMHIDIHNSNRTLHIYT